MMPQPETQPTAAQRAATARSRTVWGALLASMTCVGGLLLLLEDQPAPRMDGVALAAAAPSAGPQTIEAIFRTRHAVAKGRWDGIVLHHSGQTHGSADDLAAEHETRGFDGLGHHFVIANGQGAEDGELHVGYRWMDQLSGCHTAGPEQGLYNERYIGVCLVGNGDRKDFTPTQLARLTELLDALCRRLDLPANSVLLHRDVASTSSPGVRFPEAALRGHLVAQNP